MIKLAFACPAYRRQIDAAHRLQDMSYMFCMAMSEGKFIPVGVSHTDGCSVAHGRNQILYWALKGGADWILMQDADTVLEPDGKVDFAFAQPVLDMVTTGDGANAAVIAAPVPQRMVGKPVWNVLKEIAGQQRRLTELEFTGKVLDVDAIGTAFMAINLRWLRDHMPKAPWFHMLHGSVEETGEPAKMGEDIFFCKQVKKAGGQILCDGRVKPRHVGLGQTGHEGDRTLVGLH